MPLAYWPKGFHVFSCGLVVFENCTPAVPKMPKDCRAWEIAILFPFTVCPRKIYAEHGGDGHDTKRGKHADDYVLQAPKDHIVTTAVAVAVTRFQSAPSFASESSVANEHRRDAAFFCHSLDTSTLASKWHWDPQKLALLTCCKPMVKMTSEGLSHVAGFSDTTTPSSWHGVALVAWGRSPSKKVPMEAVDEIIPWWFVGCQSQWCVGQKKTGFLTSKDLPLEKRIWTIPKSI